MASEGKLTSSNMKVEIQSKKWIKPSTPTPSHLHKLKLSSFDQLLAPFFVKLIFHFDIVGNETDMQTTCAERQIARLEESLSEVLTLYYPFAGRYNNEHESSVLCQDQGVEFVVVDVDRKLDELNVDDDKEILLSGLERLQSTWDGAWTPVVLVQVNVFTCGRLAIGLGFFHKVGDMFTISTFMDAWATVCRLGTLNKVVHPSFNTWSFLPPRESPENPPPPPPPSGTPKYVVKRYIFSGEAISRLKSKLNTTDNYTQVELVTALIARSLINNIIECSTIRPRPVVMYHWMNLRLRTTLPIEENSCGNLLTVVNIKAAQDQVLEESGELQDVARLVRNSLRNVASEIRKVQDWNELSQKVEKAWMEFFEGERKGDQDKVNLVRFSSWCRFPLYEVDFGWGRPNLVSPIQEQSSVFIYLMDYYCNTSDSSSGGIEAWVNLKENDMVRFRYQPDILEYAS